jgi:hypothetical protein
LTVEIDKDGSQKSSDETFHSDDVDSNSNSKPDSGLDVSFLALSANKNIFYDDVDHLVETDVW